MTVGLCGGLLAVALLVLFSSSLFSGQGRVQATTPQGEAPREEGKAIPVKTRKPMLKTVSRVLEQPGSVKPWAQAELYAKASGYLKAIKRDIPSSLAAKIKPESEEWKRLPLINIGSFVEEGDVLLDIDAPEVLQDIAQKESLLKQADTELELARTTVATFQAQIQAAEAAKFQVEAEVGKVVSEQKLQEKSLDRLRQLAREKAIRDELVDEQQNRLNAAISSVDSTRAKVKAAEADYLVVSSKMSTARADVLVKEARVQVAKDELKRARVMADYLKVRAPFSGVISSRKIDEGDFIQNSTTGQTKPLFVVTDISKVTFTIDVPERESRWVRVGTEVILHLHGIEDGTIKAKVSRFAPILDAQTRTQRVEIDLENKDRKLLPGMYGEANLILQKIDNAYTLPATAVYSREGLNYIMVVEQGVARRYRIRILFDDGKEVVVAKLVDNKEVPLTGTEEIIVSNKGEIAEGQTVIASRRAD